eukprot:5553336-Pleurochrysis_carterae.AAC.1
MYARRAKERLGGEREERGRGSKARARAKKRDENEERGREAQETSFGKNKYRRATTLAGR